MGRCRSTLVSLEQDGFLPRALRALTGRAGRQFPLALSFCCADILEALRSPGRQVRMSLSGAQMKCAVTLRRGELILTPPGEVSTHILKPIPTQPFQDVAEVPANEHLTMQIAEQCFGIQTASNALITFADGEPVYVTRRFDRGGDGAVLNQEDFAQLSNGEGRAITEASKYEGSYEEIGQLIRRYSRAPRIDCLRFFRVVIFNLLFSNGDAHKKNFSLLEFAPGDYRLSPAYDLLCTRLHFPDESRMALHLFVNDDETPFFQANGFYGYPDFILFAQCLGIQPEEAERVLRDFTRCQEEVVRLIEASFLSPEARERYRAYFYDRLRLLER